MFVDRYMAEELTKTILELDDIKKIEPELAEVKIINRETCEKIQVIIFGKEKNTLKVLTTNNYPDQLHKVLKMLEDKGYSNSLYYTSVEGFNEAMKWYDQLEKNEATEAQTAKEQKEAAGRGAIAMIQKLFEERNSKEPWDFIMELVRLSFQAGASDLHFQPQESGVVMRLRVDGVLQEVLEFTHEDFVKYIQKLKFIAGTKMNVDYIPQDGRFSFKADIDGEMKQIDARVNFMPGMGSESTVIRYLDGTKGIQTFENIWFQGKTYDVLKKNLEKNVGMMLVTGPTGSGKTTTLYSILGYLNDGKEKIITLEDPVEYQVEWLQQSQINDSKGYSYELGLKAILRHDPDIVLVWETRTLETAEISISAALTGHSVFTTLHTNSAIESISRILSMGVKPYMLAPALNAILAQRLVRKVCPHCMVKREAAYAEKSEIEETIKKIKDMDPTFEIEFDGNIPHSEGCDQCNGTWYKGRIAILEMLDVTDEIKTMIIEGRSTIDIYGQARQQWFLTLKEDGVVKLIQGKTTLDELRRVL